MIIHNFLTTPWEDIFWIKEDMPTAGGSHCPVIVKSLGHSADLESFSLSVTLLSEVIEDLIASVQENS